MVDDFGIKYTHKKTRTTSYQPLQAKFVVTQEWTGGIYCGIKLKWDYKKRQLDISMPGYVKCALHKFQHPIPTIPQHSPHQWMAPEYGSTASQLAHPKDNYAEHNPEEANEVQQVVGTFLYYATFHT